MSASLYVDDELLTICIKVSHDINADMLVNLERPVIALVAHVCKIICDIIYEFIPLAVSVLLLTV